MDHDHQSDNHDDHGDHHSHETMMRNRFWVTLVLTIPVLLYSPTIQEWLGFSMPSFPGSAYIGVVLATIIFLIGGLLFLQMAWGELKKGQPGMMTLISLGVTVAYVYSLLTRFVVDGKSFFWEMATLVVVMLLGHWVEMRSVRRASSALDELAKLMPSEAERITDDGDTETVKVSQLEQGDRVLVRPGASIPADGEVIEGESKVNEAMVTGESKPVDKQPGDDVIGGTVNQSGSLRVEVKATGDETALAGIMRLVDDAQQSKSETQMLADKAAGWLFYIALGAAILTAAAWTIAQGFQIEVLERVVTVLVIACPHALGLAIPLVVAISTSLGAREGILLRDRLALEAARELDVIMFDKTGTLTEGSHKVVDSATAEGRDPAAMLALAAAVEADSEHMLARAIRQAAEEQSLDVPDVSNFEAIEGKGVKATTTDEETVYVGGPRLLEEHDLTPQGPLAELTESAHEAGRTVVYLIEGGQLAAGFVMADAIREESREAIDYLHEMDLEVAMLTGDSQAVAEAVAAELGIDTVFAEVLPENKDEKVSQLQSEGKKVAMVGDGINDAPALARADVGIAIGSGTDVAVESAGIVLVQSNPLDVVNVIKLSRATYRKMMQNLAWATGYNVIAIPLAAGVLAPIGFILPPAVGAIAMSVSTVIVAINAQFLRSVDLV